MKHLYIRKAGIFLGKLGICTMSGFAVWLICGIAEYPALWWLYALAAFGAFALAALCLGLTVQAEDELAAEIARSQSVPVRKIERRSSQRHSA